MTDLSRHLIDAAREGLAPDPATAARVRARVAAAIGAPVAAATTAATTVPAKAAAVPAKAAGIAFPSAALKIGVVTLLAIGVVVAVVVGRGTASEVAPAVGVTSTEQEPTSAPHVAASEHLAAPAGAAATTGAAAHTTAPTGAHTTGAHTTAAPTTAAPTTATPASQPALAREVELIDRAMLSLRRGSATDALAAVATFDRETRGRGQLAEDAAAIAIEAHCSLHHDVTARIAAFDRAYPTSAQRARLRTACE